MPEHFQAAFGAERVGNECPPYLAESVLQKQKPNNAVADTREWTRITPIT